MRICFLIFGSFVGWVLSQNLAAASYIELHAGTNSTACGPYPDIGQHQPSLPEYSCLVSDDSGIAAGSVNRVTGELKAYTSSVSGYGTPAVWTQIGEHFALEVDPGHTGLVSLTFQMHAEGTWMWNMAENSSQQYAHNWGKVGLDLYETDVLGGETIPPEAESYDHGTLGEANLRWGIEYTGDPSNPGTAYSEFTLENGIFSGVVDEILTLTVDIDPDETTGFFLLESALWCQTWGVGECNFANTATLNVFVSEGAELVPLDPRFLSDPAFRDPQDVAEPGPIGLLLFGLAGLGFTTRRRT